jgi:cell division protein FtsB
MTSANNMTKYSLTSSDLCNAPKSKWCRFNKTVVWVVLLVVLFGSLVTYLAQVNTIASKGFALRDLEKQINVLQMENEKLSVQVIELQAMGALNDKVAELNMVPVNKVVYFNGADQVVARR